MPQDVPELLAAVDSVVFVDVDCEPLANEPRPVVPREVVPRFEVPRLAVPCTIVLGEELGAAAGEEFAAALLVAAADVDIEAEFAVAVAVIPDVLTDGQGPCTPLAALDAADGRPLIMAFTESLNPPPSKVEIAGVLGFATEQGMTVVE